MLAGRGEETGAVGFRPLYLQVREEIARQIASGRWQQGTALPSEIDLARELGVSQGTVRKALDALTADSVLVRRQGRGTFIAEFEESRIFHFFRLHPETGDRVAPQSTILARTTGKATAQERRALNLDVSDKVIRFERLRSYAGTTIIREHISLPTEMFPGLAAMSEIPNNLYHFYSKRWGITITKSKEKLQAVAATSEDGQHLAVPEGHPLLHIERVAFDINKRPVEYRHSFCLTTDLHYESDVV